MHSLVFLLTAIASLFLANAYHYYQCQPCEGEECNAWPEDCKYNVTRDPCGRLTCRAGPGQRCGGRDNHNGKCGEGMDCVCGKCRGCSVDRLNNENIVECNYNTMPVCY